MTHDTPNINGMGAYEGLRSGVLLQQKLVRHARQAIADLDDATLASVLTDELARRPNVARRIMGAMKEMKND